MRSASSFALVCLISLVSLFAACGGGSHSSSSSSSNQPVSPPPPSANTQPIVVNGGPGNNYANGVFTTVTICAPGSSNCQSISGVLVDTGSFGLRVLKTALGTLADALPQQKDSGGNSIVECAQFVDSVIWGPVKMADVTMAGEKAASIPMQVIDDTVTPIASGCKSVGPAEEDLSSLGANGILGIGFFIQDCGGACALSGSSNPGFYYSCSGATCQVTAEALSQQVQNPVASFATDKNGVVLQLPATTANAASLNGSLVFGIGTESNNALGSAQKFIPDSSGNLTTTFKGQAYSGFIDSGSNAYFFLTSTQTGLPDCPTTEKGFYCPTSPVNLSATNSGSSGTATSTVNFTIDNASQLLANGSDFVFPTLGGPNASTFDWGLPFFFGRTVFIGLESPAGSGPFWAY